jgi:hypothetical protein
MAVLRAARSQKVAQDTTAQQQQQHDMGALHAALLRRQQAGEVDPALLGLLLG